MEIIGRDGLSASDGAPPNVDLALERKNGDFVRAEIISGCATACHDISSGGLLVALAEMAMASNLGANVEDLSANTPIHAWAFGEDQARYIVTTLDAEGMLERAEKSGVYATLAGTVATINEGQELTIGNNHSISVAELKDAHENWMPDFMSHPEAH